MTDEHFSRISKQTKSAVKNVSAERQHSVQPLADWPLAKAFGWGYARGIPTDDLLRAYRQKK